LVYRYLMMRAGQQIEESAGVDPTGLIEDTLLRRGALVRMHGGWLAGVMGWVSQPSAYHSYGFAPIIFSLLE